MAKITSVKTPVRACLFHGSSSVCQEKGCWHAVGTDYCGAKFCECDAPIVSVEAYEDFKKLSKKHKINLRYL